MRDKLHPFKSLPFLICLGLLLLNDFYLKEIFHNGLTGKLSDCCGLFIFPIFWSAIFPKRKKEVYVLTAILFVLWKSPFSQAFIDFFSLYVFSITRVIDISDLWALLVLPLAFKADSWNQYREKLNVHPYIIGLISFLSFCATSRPIKIQQFENPQFILLKPMWLEFEASGWNEFETFDLDSLQVIEVKQIVLRKWPVLEDEFQKVLVLKDLDLLLLEQAIHTEEINLQGPEKVLDSLTFSGETQVILNKEKYRDILNFRGTRLEGDFTRETHDAKPIIKGYYKDGIEDSTWVYFNEKSEVIQEKNFMKGELTEIITYENSQELSVQNFSTREQKVQSKYFHLAIWSLLAIGIIVYLVKSHKNTSDEEYKLSHIKKIGYSLGLSILVVALDVLYIDLMANHYGEMGLDRLFSWISVFILSLPAFLVVFYVIKPKKVIDMLAYVLLFSLAAIWMHDLGYLNALLADMKLLNP